MTGTRVYGLAGCHLEMSLLYILFCLHPDCYMLYTFVKRPLLDYIFGQALLLAYIFGSRPLLPYLISSRPLLGYTYGLRLLSGYTGLIRLYSQLGHIGTAQVRGRGSLVLRLRWMLHWEQGLLSYCIGCRFTRYLAWISYTSSYRTVLHGCTFQIYGGPIRVQAQSVGPYTHVHQHFAVQTWISTSWRIHLLGSGGQNSGVIFYLFPTLFTIHTQSFYDAYWGTIFLVLIQYFAFVSRCKTKHEPTMLSLPLVALLLETCDKHQLFLDHPSLYLQLLAYHLFLRLALYILLAYICICISISLVQ